MATVIVHHEVKDYDGWKRTFDAVADFRKAGGEESAQIFRNADNPNLITGVIQYSSLDAARAHFSNPEMKSKMAEAGVVGKPEVHFVSPA